MDVTTDARYGVPDAIAPDWSEVEEQLRTAPLSWISTVRPDGRPHVTPLITVWLDGAPHLCTGAPERKALNLLANPACVLTTGNAVEEGRDVVVEGTAVRVTDPATLERVRDGYLDKYGEDWRFELAEDGFASPHGTAWVLRIEVETVFAFTKGDAPSQARYRVPQRSATSTT